MDIFEGSGCLTTILMILLALLLIFIFDLIFAWPFMLLWNWLMPVIFGLTTITFWQSFGLLILASFIFKSTTNINSK